MEIIIAIIIAITSATPSLHVDGLDGIVNLTDDYGNIMIVEADCARVIVDTGITNLEEVHRNGVTSTDAYLEACF